MTEVISKSAEDTKFFAEKLAKALKGGEVIAYFGGLGMGKTTFTAGLLKGLGRNAEVSSPTFALVHDYGGTPAFYHFDMYRINSFDDLYSTGFFDYLDSGGILAVEWSENIEGALPDNIIRIDFLTTQNENERILRMSGEEEYENTWR